MSTLPVPLVLKMVLAALTNQVNETRRRLERNRAPTGAAGKVAGRQLSLKRLEGEASNVAMLLRSEQRGRIPCEVAALLTALAFGHSEARADLLASVENPTRDRIAALPGWDITGAICAILGKEEFVTLDENPDED